MLYSLFIYQSKTGLLLWEKSFEDDLNQKSELFSSFFSAIQSFVKEMILTTSSGKESKGIETIEMGNFLINVTDVHQLEVDIVCIADKSDAKSLKKFLPKVLKLLSNHKELFTEWDGDKSRYDVLDLEILQIIKDTKELMGNKSLVDERTELLNEIINNMPELENDQIDNYQRELTYLDERLSKTTNIFKKLDLLNSKDHVYQKLKNKEGLNRNEMDRRKLLTELKNTKDRLQYFLSETKNAISNAVEHAQGKLLYDIDFKNAYLNLYSFSTKLKFVGNQDLAEKYRNVAQIFIDKPENKKEEFSAIIREILNLPDDINHFIVKE